MSIIVEPSKTIHLMQCFYALKIEVSTGLRHSRGSVLKMLQRVYDIKATKKLAAMAEILDLIDAEGDHDTTQMRAQLEQMNDAS